MPLPGLSHRKGLRSSQNDPEAVMSGCMQSPPVDVKCGLSEHPSDEAVDAMLSHHWVGCNKYFYRSLARRALLHAAMQKPSQVTVLLYSSCGNVE